MYRRHTDVKIVFQHLRLLVNLEKDPEYFGHEVHRMRDKPISQYLETSHIYQAYLSSFVVSGVSHIYRDAWES
jgi:hypothetical protein